MSILQRTVFVQPDAGTGIEALFEQLSLDLRQMVVSWLGKDSDYELLAGWPDINLVIGNRRVVVDAWQSQRMLLHRLLTIELKDIRPASDSTSVFKLGMLNGGNVVLYEGFDVHPLQARLPVDEVPQLTDFLAGHSCKDEDELIPGKPYVLSRERLPQFLKFLQSPQNLRQLPIVLISTTFGRVRQHLLDRQMLAWRIARIAHVIAVDAGDAWYKDDIPFEHKCFGGAVRIYLPGYRSDDPLKLHPLWHPDRLEAANSTTVMDEIVRYIIEKHHLFFRMNPMLVQLERERSESFQAAAFQRRIDSLREQMSERENERFSEFLSEYEALENRYNELRAQLKQRDDELRNARYLLNKEWSAEDSNKPSEVEYRETPKLMLSNRALDVYQRMDKNEQERIRKTLLVKLLEPELREQQSEVRAAVDTTCWIYPRGHSSNGQRAIYIMRGSSVHVCELFANHADYEEAWAKGVSVATYEVFDEFPL